MNKAVAKADEVISTLNELIEICRDGQKGFAEAAEKIQNLEIKDFCLEQSRTRATCVGELQQEVKRLGGDPEKAGSMTGAVHRAWIDLKSALGGGDHAIIAACETGEDAAVREYEKALAKKLPTNVHAIVDQQYRSVKQSHDRVKQMRDSLTK